MAGIITIAVIVVVVVLIIRKVKEEVEYRADKRKEDEERVKTYAERKKSGNPSVSDALPFAADYFGDEEAKMVTGADGKEYPDKDTAFEEVTSANFDKWDFDHKKYEFSPVYGILALEHFVKKFESEIPGKLKKFGELDEGTVDEAFQGLYELGESYYYPVPGRDDLTHFMHYEVRYKQDWLRAMDGNGYYKNAYNIPLNAQKALAWFEMSDAWLAKYQKAVVGKGEETAIKMTRCKLQTAHILSAGLYGVTKDVNKASSLYSQAYQLASHYAQEDITAELICALIQGYPRDPEDYFISVVNMLADWACRSDLGLAMFVEYTQYASKLDKKVLAQSPESVVELCRAQAEDNHYAAYLLGTALLAGYGTGMDPEIGTTLLEIAAADGSVFAAYALWQLASDNKEKQAAQKAALDSLVKTVSSANSHIRAELEAEGMNITGGQSAMVKAQAEKIVAEETRKAQEKYAQEMAQKLEKELEKLSESTRFSFPAVIHDADMNRWELRSVSAGLARYECMSGSGIKDLDRVDIERLKLQKGVNFE